MNVELDTILATIPFNTVVDYILKAIALIVLWFIAKLVLRNKEQWLKRSNGVLKAVQVRERSIPLINEIIDYAIVVTGIIIALNILGVTTPLYSALTAAGISGIIVGLAAKDVVANFISGVTLLLDHTFVVGDSIEVDDYSGEVVDIALRVTTVVSWDGLKIAIPNNMLTTNPVINYSTAPQRRILFNVPLAIDSDVSLAQEVLMEIIDREERVLKDQTIAVRVDEIRDGAVDLQVLCYTTASVLFDTQSDLKRDIILALREEQNVALARYNFPLVDA